MEKILRFARDDERIGVILSEAKDLPHKIGNSIASTHAKGADCNVSK